MRGMNPHTGRSIGGLAHLAQSIPRVLTTPVGTRLSRRWFGSELMQLVDAPNNPATQVRLYAAVATALMRCEPRLKLTRVSLARTGQSTGEQVIDIQGVARESGEAIATTVRVRAGGAA